jgi:hypothetical protein
VPELGPLGSVRGALSDERPLTAGYTGSRGTGEVRPRGKSCCHRLQSADSSRGLLEMKY